MAASLSPTVWRRTGAGEYAAPVRRPAVPEVFRTHRSAFRRLTLPNRFPNPRVPRKRNLAASGCACMQCGQCSSRIQMRRQKAFFRQQPKAHPRITPHRCAYRAFCRQTFGLHVVRNGRPAHRKRGQERTPALFCARRSLRAVLHSAQRQAAVFTAGRICTSIFPLVFSNSATQRLIYCSISLLADRPSDSAI